MADVVRELVNKVGYRLNQASARAVEATTNRLKSRMSDLARAAAAAAAALLGARAVRFFTSDMAKAGDEIIKTSRSLGIATDALQEMRFAFAIGGASTQQVNTGLRTLAKRANDARNGLKSASRVFDELGVTVKTSDGRLRGLDQITKDLADRFRGMTDGTKRAAFAQELFGRSGLSFINTLQGGRAGMDQLGAEAQRLGRVMSRESLLASEAYNDSLLRVKSVIIGLRNQIGARLLPRITQLADRFTKWATTGDNLSRILKGLKATGAALWQILKSLAVVKAGAMFIAMAQGALAFGVALRSAATASALFRAALGPVLLVITGILAGAQALHAFLSGKTGALEKLVGDPKAAAQIRNAIAAIAKVAKNLIGTLLKAGASLLKALAPALPAIAKILTFIVTVVGKALAFIVRAVTGLMAMLRPIFAAIWNVLITVLKPVWEVIKQVFQTLKPILTAVISALKPIFKSIADFMKGPLGQALKFFIGAMAKGFKLVLSVIEKIIAGVKWLIGGVKKVTDFIGLTGDSLADKALRAQARQQQRNAKIIEDTALKLFGGPEGAARALGIGGAPARPAAAGQTNNVTGTTVTVNVTGVAGATEAGGAIAARAREGVNAAFKDTFRNLRGTD